MLQCKWGHMVDTFGSNACGATWWPVFVLGNVSGAKWWLNLELMQVAPPGDQICWYKASDPKCWPNLQSRI